jgi:hypothetical protein
MCIFFYYYFEYYIINIKANQQAISTLVCSRVYLFSYIFVVAQSVASERKRALALVSFMLNCCARSTMALRVLDEVECAISPEKERFCMSNTSNSFKKEKTIRIFD